ncbi:helicase protein, partial [Ostertagia ostertagi]
PTDLLELLSTNEFEEILVDSSDDTEFTQKLWDALTNSPMNSALYDTILHYLATAKCFLKLEEFWAHLDVDKTLEFLKGIQYYNTVTSRIEKSLEGVEDIPTKKRVVLRTVPLLGDNAIYDLMRSIYYNSEQSAEFVDKLHPNFLRFYDLPSISHSSETLTGRLLKAIDDRSFAVMSDGVKRSIGRFWGISSIMKKSRELLPLRSCGMWSLVCLLYITTHYTKHIVVNLLEENTISDGIENVIRSPFEVTTFTMMVFDECHNAVKNSPYSKLLRFYHRLSFSQRIPSKAALPQIIGLTASLGVGGKSTEKDAVAHVIRLCAMLNCKAISTVRKNVGELKKFSPEVFDEIHSCGGQNDSERSRYLGTICELMKIFETQLNLIYIMPSNRRKESLLTKRTLPTMVNYIVRIPNMRLHLKTKHRSNLYRAIEMFEDFSSEESFKFLNEQMEWRSASLTSFSRDHWIKYSEKAACMHLHNNSSKDSRTIVFIRTRRGASALAEILNKHPVMVSDGIRVECIAGLNKGTCETTTKREQMEKLRRFRDGETRVLVATSVADEGLDVAKCNLVIKYNCATNEIAHVQRRGRGRAENSRSILITQNLKLVEQEEKNVLKVQEGLTELLRDIQREDANVAQRIALQKASGKVYRLLCSKCDAFLCTSNDIKTYKGTQYCVCDPSFWAKTRHELVRGQLSTTEEKFAIAKLCCVSPNCVNVLGRIMCIEQIMMPVLSAQACVFEYYNGTEPIRRTVRKWITVKEEFFTPDEIRNYDLAAMNEAAVRPNIKSEGVA